MNHDISTDHKPSAIERGILRRLRRIFQALWNWPSPATGIMGKPYSAHVGARHEVNEQRLTDFRNEAQFRRMMRGYF